MTDPNQGAASSKRARSFTILIVLILFAVGAVQALTRSSGSVTSQVDGKLLGVSGTYGDAVFLELDTVTEVQLVDSFDFGTCVDGEETKNTVSGTYRCAEYGEYTVHAYSGVPAYIIVHSPEGVLVFNAASTSLTEKTYNQLAQAVDTGK